ncbi:SpoIIE family protein phosphatase [Nocardioides sp. BP30]|uniref:SpoIIE family protein phosphatase n=1 Tax=Nocardioides sp. BP30 TaxID=3036374 RepID=UPI0024695075|nr:SpoIIE family protein phosphatase [Nocardioides sp. BP30]WGL54201.1 SpoIIE family protein phosphatase [Nocardioides sp. BP30]
MRVAALPGATGDSWWNVTESAAVPAVRRAAAALASDLGLDPERVAEVGIVVTELATNLVKHAGGGELVLRVLGEGDRAAVRVLAIDAGPGSRNIDALISDGASTRGTLGIGLGACQRLASAFDVYSVPALGTIAQAIMGPDPAGTRDHLEQGGGADVAALTRPLSGEGPCGDTAAHRTTDEIQLVMVADGLGHGPLAAAASQRAADVLMSLDSVSPAAVLERIHASLGGTRGAAVTVVSYDPATRRLVHAGIGNVAARLVGPGGTRTLPAQPGIAGHRAPRLRETTYPVEPASLVVMHTDGLSQRWSPADMPDVLTHAPGVVCAALVRAAASRRDDAGVLVLRTAA